MRAWLERSFVRSLLGEEGERERRAYRQFMSEPDSDELNSLFSRKRIPALLGTKESIDRLKAKFRNLRNQPEIPESKILSPGIDAIKIAVCTAYKIVGSDLLWTRRGTTNEARNVAIYLCPRLSGETPTSIGQEFHLANYGSVRSVVSRMKKTLRHDGKLPKRAGRVKRELRMAQIQT